jgi:outer membrane receptor for ferric coprogen and ferric-rhodotorulic acid
MLSGIKSNGLQGSYGVDAGLEKLLLNAPLNFRASGSNAFIIEKRRANVLATAQVIDKTLGSNTEGTGSYTTGSMRSATGLNLSMRDTPQSVTVITRQIMDDFSLDTVDAVLANTTGINVNRIETDRAYPSARGFDIDYLQIDGVSSEASGMMNSDLLADTVTYDRVEVIRGAAGLLSGAGNPSATINLVRKRPTKEFNGYAKVTGGSWNAARIEGDISGSLTNNGSVSARLVTAYDSRESYINFYANDRTVVYGIAEFDVTDHTIASVGIDYQKEDINGSTYGEPVPFFYDNGAATNFDRSTTTSAPWSYKNKERTIIFADLNHEFNNGWQAKASVSKLTDTMESYLVYLYGYVNKETGLGLNDFLLPYDSDRDVENISLSTNGNFTLFGREHELLLGWNQTNEKISRVSYKSPDIEVGDFYQWPVAAPSDQRKHNKDWGWENKQSGAFITSRWNVTDPLTLLLGTRLSNWDTQDWENGVNGLGYEHNNVLTPYAGVVYHLNDNLSLYSSYTKVFKPQNNKDRQGDFLEPKEGINIEAGIKGEFFDGSLNSSFALFHVEQANVAEEDIMIDGEQRYKAIEGIKVKGFETELSGELLTGLNMIAGYTYRDAEQVDGSKATTYEPEHMLRISGNYQLSGTLEQWYVGGAIRWQSEIYTNKKGPNGERAAQAAFAVADMMIRYQITESISANVNINNIFDKKYYSAVPHYNAAYYGAPRNASLSVRASF